MLPPHTGTPATASLFIVNPFAGTESLGRWFSTHPETAERVRRLRALDLRRSGQAQPGRWPLPAGG